jgi:hypothetical protein
MQLQVSKSRILTRTRRVGLIRNWFLLFSFKLFKFLCYLDSLITQNPHPCTTWHVSHVAYVPLIMHTKRLPLASTSESTLMINS